LSCLSPQSLALIVAAALLLDRLLGEPGRFHPLAGFGLIAGWMERRANRPGTPLPGAVRGLLAWAILCLPAPLLLHEALAGARSVSPWLAFFVNAAVLYFCIALRSLGEHGMAVAAALADEDSDDGNPNGENNPVRSRAAVARMVSRDCAGMNRRQIAAAAVESVLENGNDAVVAPSFWFVLLGAPGALLYRFANTLDAMWGYRTRRYRRFGYAAARLDDLLNLVPARICALLYGLSGGAAAFSAWRRQAGGWSSPNAGPVMASGAGALGIEIGGCSRYHGETVMRPVLGRGRRARPADIQRAVRLVTGTALKLAGLLIVGEVALCRLSMAAT